jgi:thioredoxin-like negative regulator of GroEL
MRLAVQALVSALALLAALSCSRSSEKPGEPASGGQADDPRAAIAKACSGAERKGPLAWYHDEYEAALACARASNRPLFIDLWAPWCHTCLAMQHSVFVDPGIAPLADRFVWLAIDTDKAGNAALQVKFPPQVWPTFYVIAPHDESVQARYLGAASVTQLREFLDQGEKGFVDATQGVLDPSSPLRLVRDGDRAVVAGDLDRAESAYKAALANAPAGWPRRPDVLVSLISALHRLQDWEGCVKLGMEEMNSTGSSASATDFVYHARVCAEGLGGEQAQALQRAAIARLAALIDDASAPLSADDRSDAMYNLRELYLAMGETDAARALAERQRVFLDDAAANAPTPLAAMTYIWPRSEVYVYLGKAAELVPVLQKSMTDLPREYDPPYRLAWVYLKLGEHEKALEAADKALSLVYGPRKGQVQRLIASIHAARGDKDAERAARAQVVAIYESLPEGQKSEGAIAQAREDLAAMDR